jgi:hypothetical protein
MGSLREKKGGLISLLVITILVILLACAVVYIGIGKYKERQIAKEQALVQQGYQAAVVQLMQEAATCQPVSVYAGNATMQLIAVECLQATPLETNSSQNMSKI